MVIVSCVLENKRQARGLLIACAPVPISDSDDHIIQASSTNSPRERTMSMLAKFRKGAEKVRLAFLPYRGVLMLTSMDNRQASRRPPS
jgi:hypothetical protein